MSLHADATPELFAGKEMGEDVLRALQEYRKLHGRICADIKNFEFPYIVWATIYVLNSMK